MRVTHAVERHDIRYIERGLPPEEVQPNSFIPRSPPLVRDQSGPGGRAGRCQANFASNDRTIHAPDALTATPARSHKQSYSPTMWMTSKRVTRRPRSQQVAVINRSHHHAAFEAPTTTFPNPFTELHAGLTLTPRRSNKLPGDDHTAASQLIPYAKRASRACAPADLLRQGQAPFRSRAPQRCLPVHCKADRPPRPPGHRHRCTYTDRLSSTSKSSACQSVG